MPFSSAIEQAISQTTEGSAERCVLEYLRDQALGRQNAKSWAEIQRHLEDNGHQMRKTTFQQGILKQSRESDLFICSNDHEPHRGYFISNSRADADLMSDWYINRITTLQKRLQRLRDNMRQEYPF